MIKLTVDEQEIKAAEGDCLLRVCLDNGIYVPNLCYIDGVDKPSASCRLCFVQIEGENKPVPSCTVKVKEGMVVMTDTEQVRRLQRSALQLLLSVHDVDCAKCPANKKCELQRMARILKVGLKPKHLEKHLQKIEVDETHPLFNYYPNRCVLCGRCVYVCKENKTRPMLTFSKRGLETVISFCVEKDSENISCEDCDSCIDVCPVGAITRK